MMANTGKLEGKIWIDIIKLGREIKLIFLYDIIKMFIFGRGEG